MGSPDQLTADSLSLVSLIDSKIRQIRAVAEVADRSGHANQPCLPSRRHDDVGMIQHRPDYIEPVDRPPFRERGAHKNVNKLGSREVWFKRIRDGHGGDGSVARYCRIDFRVARRVRAGTRVSGVSRLTVGNGLARSVVEAEE